MCSSDLGKQIVESTRHGPASGAAGEHKRAVDIKEDDFGHGRNRLYVAIPTVALTRRSCRFAANVARARPLGRWLFFEADALAFVQLVEAALHRAPVKKPFLPTVVADEAETPVSNESLDRAARHPSLLWAHGAQVRIINFRSTIRYAEFAHVPRQS